MNGQQESNSAAALDTTVHRALSKDSRLQLLRALTAAGEPLGARELAQQVGLHLTTVRAHLNVLEEAGLVESEPEPRTTPGRPRLLYRPAAGPSQEVVGYRLLTEVLASHLAGTAADPTELATAAGRVWGEYLTDRPPPFANVTPDEARTRLLELFDRLGFEPEFDGDGTRMMLRRCPFLEVARRHPDVVCSVHLGLLQGALDALGNPLTAEHLEAFAQPSLCLAHLAGHST